jgi:hypothetical protein
VTSPAARRAVSPPVVSPATASPATASPATASPAVVGPHAVARETADAGLIRFVWALAVVPPLLALAQVLANTRDYCQPAVVVAVWLVVLASGAWLVPRLRTGGLGALETAGAIGISLGAVVATGAFHRMNDATGGIDLAVLGTAWLLVLLVLRRPVWVWLPAALLVFAVHALFLVRDEGPHRIVLPALAAAAYVIATAMLVFAALRSALDSHVEGAARQAALASQLAAERAAEAAVEQERRGRLMVLEREALPLLRAIADGTLDSGDPGVRELCARHAAVLRQSLVGRVPGGGLAAGLEPALESAAARGLTVTVQLIQDPGTAPLVAQAACAAVAAVLGTLPPQPAVLTVLAAGADTELHLTFGTPPPAAVDLTPFGRGLPGAARWHAAVSATDDGGGCLEISWRGGAG